MISFAMLIQFCIAFGRLALTLASDQSFQGDVHFPIFTGDCHPGYHGYRCQELCPYPRFGLQCKGRCKCKQKLCHYVNGCPPLVPLCPAGYTGKYCNKPCQFPNYGYGCQQQCLCSRRLCSISTGCAKIKSSNKEIQGYLIGKNNTGSYKGSTVAKQLEQQKVYEPIKETANGQLENTIFRQRQENPVTWIQIIIISVGCLLAVMVIVHVVISIVNCVNVTQKITD